MITNNNQKKILLAGSLILITIFLYSAMIYNLNYFREIVIKTLLTKDGYANVYSKKYPLTADIEISLPSQSTSTPPVAISTPVEKAQKISEYKMVLDPDPCTLNNLGSDGWQISQASSADLDIVRGLDGDCHKYGSYPTLPWILFVR